MKDALFRKILLCFDNSELSKTASEVALLLAQAFRVEVAGLHGYNAVMHEGAFRMMEPTLPSQYQQEEVLHKQRAIHNTLINVGMEKISLAYLEPLEEIFSRHNLRFTPKVREGKNFAAVNGMIAEEPDGLVVISVAGFNSNGSGFMGSVCSRVLRSNDRDMLLVKKPMDADAPIYVVALDGSRCSLRALKAAQHFAWQFNGRLHLVYVFDAHLHKSIFDRLKDSVIDKDGFTFNSTEQEKLHDEFIDKGLIRVGDMILDKAQKEITLKDTAMEIQPPVKKVLIGHVYEEICEYAGQVKADMVFAGRTGRHYAKGVDIGSVSENVARYAPGNTYIAGSEEFAGWEI